MQIIDADQHAAMSFIAAANHGGHRPHSEDVLEWLKQPDPMPAQPGPLIKRGRPAQYQRVGGLSESISNMIDTQSILKTALANIDAGLNQHLKGIAGSFTKSAMPALAHVALGRQILISEGTPDEYGPGTPAESVVDCLVRLNWVNQDDRGKLGLTSLGRALLRNHETAASSSDAYEVVVLDSHNDLSYPLLIRTLAEAGDALLIDPYLRLDQLLAVKAYTSVTRVLISDRISQQDQVAMRVLVASGFDRNFDLRVAAPGTLHDRMIIGLDNVFTIGTSMNTVGRQHPTILSTLPDFAADKMREHAEQWWDDASRLASFPPDEPEPE